MSRAAYHQKVANIFGQNDFSFCPWDGVLTFSTHVNISEYSLVVVQQSSHT